MRRVIERIIDLTFRFAWLLGIALVIGILVYFMKKVGM